MRRLRAGHLLLRQSYTDGTVVADVMLARCDACHGILAVAQPSAHTIQAACDARETPVCPLSLDLAYKQKLHAGADEALQKLTTLSGEETRLSVINELG